MNPSVYSHCAQPCPRGCTRGQVYGAVCHVHDIIIQCLGPVMDTKTWHVLPAARAAGVCADAAGGAGGSDTPDPVLAQPVTPAPEETPQKVTEVDLEESPGGPASSSPSPTLVRYLPGVVEQPNHTRRLGHRSGRVI